MNLNMAPLGQKSMMFCFKNYFCKYIVLYVDSYHEHILSSSCSNGTPAAYCMYCIIQ